MSEIKDKESWHGHTNAEVENYIKNRLDNSAGYKKILYAELKELRDNNKLVPGMQYRITDYKCTTTEMDTRSAGNQFDIIVTADSNNMLNENARAIQHDGDEYFSNSNLATWELKYCLDNDRSRFYWADPTNGKGVIYRMIDEFNNDIPYDFKNIQFRHHNNNTTKYPHYYYTFASGNVANNTDTSINPKSISVRNNTMGTYIINSSVQGLNRNIFIRNNCYNNTFGNNCYNNIFGNNCYNNTFGNNCYDNTFGDGCYNNTFGNWCYNNTFGDGCYRNIFVKNCHNNVFGNNCCDNIFKNDCNHINIQKDYMQYIIVEIGNMYIDITSAQTTNAQNKLMNFTIAQGVNNTETAKTISHDTVNDTFKTTYQPANSVVVNI